MWSRRTFLQNSSIAIAALGAFEVSALAARAGDGRGPLNRPIGIQLYTVRDAVAKDLPGTLKQLAAIGYREVELAGGPQRPVAEMRQLLADNGLTCPSVHANMLELQAAADEKIEFVRALGAQYLVCSFPWTADSRFKTGGTQGIAGGITLDDWKWNAEQLNRIGERARVAGVRMGYHNHNMEFRSYAGVVGFDELLRRTDPALVTIELDIAWVVTAGADPMHYLTKHADRVSLLHVKEVREDLQVMRDKLVAQTTEVGSGKIDWRRLFAAMDPKQIKHYFVEQENFERSPLEAAKISYDYLKTLKTSAEEQE
jgi:sugar phosphate isomerase/epimerase